MQQVATRSFYTLNLSDWNHTRTATLDLPADASVAEAVDEARQELGLPNDVGYLALHGNRQLDRLSMLSELDLDDGAEIELMADVKAGS